MEYLQGSRTDAEYAVIAAIIASIAFLSAFTYQLAGFFLDQDYDKPGPLWKKAKKAFVVYFRFVDDGNTELVLNGTFAIFVLLWLTKQACWLQWVICFSWVVGKCFVNYRVRPKPLIGELYSEYFRKEIWGDIKEEGGIKKFWFFYVYLVVLIIFPFTLLPTRSELPWWLSWWYQPVTHIALYGVVAHIVFWILAAEIWRPGETLARAKNLKVPEIDSWMIKRCHDLAAAEYEDNDRHRDRKTDTLIGEIAKTVIAKNSKLKLLYAGCGPGEILLKLQNSKNLWSEMLAIDFSQKVIDLAKTRLGSPSSHGVEFGKFDFMHIHQYTGTIKPENFDLVACLNNTLGNIVPRGVELASIDRKKCIAEFFNVLKPGGKLFLSVYNVEHLNKDDVLSTPICQCQLGDATKKEGDAKKRLYSDNLILDDDLSDVDKGDLIMEPISQDNPEADSHSPYQPYFYSHWFSTGEVRRLLEESGFVDVRVYREGDQNPPQRIIAVGVK